SLAPGAGRHGDERLRPGRHRLAMRHNATLQGENAEDQEPQGEAVHGGRRIGERSGDHVATRAASLRAAAAGSAPVATKSTTTAISLVLAVVARAPSGRASMRSPIL